MRKAEELVGFTDALLDILQGEQEASIRLSSKSEPTPPEERGGGGLLYHLQIC